MTNFRMTNAGCGDEAFIENALVRESLLSFAVKFEGFQI